MKKLLVPTDFSDASRNAVEYAGGLAAALGAEIQLFHAYQIVKTAEMFVSVNDIIEEDLENEYNGLVKSLHAKFGDDLVIHYKYLEGNPVDTINREAQKGNYDLIVIGMQGKSALEKLLLGSVASGLLNTCKKPVLAIPSEAHFKPIKSIVVATEGQYINDQALFGPFLEWAKLFDGQVDLFSHREEKDINLDIKKHFTWDGIPFTMHIHENEEDAHVALDHFMENHQSDLLVMLHHVREFWARLFNPSFTKAQAKKTFIPVLVLPI